MKQCPACRTTYTDQTLRYCLADGSVLNDVSDEQATVVRTPGVRVEIPRENAQTALPPAVQPTVPASSGMFKVAVVVIGLGILAVVAVAAGTFIYFNLRGTESAPNINGKDAKTTASPTPAKDDKDELRDQIANLERQLNEQKKTKQPANIPLSMPRQSATTTTARANSPSDGFLALRSLPSSELGDRILKIPHGATVTIGACGPVIRPVSRSGRWCQASYNGTSGWVFDAYLIY
jgi:hypothetical protein